MLALLCSTVFVLLYFLLHDHWSVFEAPLVLFAQSDDGTGGRWDASCIIVQLIGQMRVTAACSYVIFLLLVLNMQFARWVTSAL